MSANLIIGTYTSRGDSNGIYAATLRDNGTFSRAKLLIRARDPSYIALGGAGDTLYAVDEQEKRGAVNSFALVDGTWFNTGSADSRGGSPCHLALSPDGSELAVANYADGVVAVCELNGGALTGRARAFEGRGGSVHPTRQAGAHAHQCNFYRGRLLVNDLGGDTVRAFEKTGGAWRETEPFLRLPGGAGPRHLALGKRGEIYVLGELDSRLHVFFPNGEKYLLAASIPLTPADRQNALAPGADNSGAGAIKLSPDGKRLLCTTRQDNKICLLDVGDDGMPRFNCAFDCGGINPRDAEFVDEYIVCACQDGGGLTCLAPELGGGAKKLDSIDISMPVCVINLNLRK